MKKGIFLLLLLCCCMSVCAQRLGTVKIYDQYVQFYTVAPKKVKVGEKFYVVVVFKQTTYTHPFNKNTDMSRSVTMPAIEGLVRLDAPRQQTYVEEGKEGGRVVSKTYDDRYVYKFEAETAGTYTINDVGFTFRGKPLTADACKILVEASEDIPEEGGLLLESEDMPEGKTPNRVAAEEDKPIVYSKPFINRKTSPQSNILEIRAYKDRTEVDITYVSQGENLYSSSNCFIRDTDTKESIKLRRLKGDIGFDKRYYAAGTKVKYTMVFPPMEKSWRNVDIIENVQGGFMFFGVGLAAKSGGNSSLAGAASVRRQIPAASYANVRNVELNNFSSDFVFTDGMLPVYNKDVYKWGFYDEKGNLAIPFKWDFETFGYPHFGGGFCIVCKEVRSTLGIKHLEYYAINKSGQPVKLQGVERATPFCDGLAAVVKSGGRYVIIKGNGQELSPSLAQYIGSNEPRPVRPFVDGLSAFYDYNKKRYGFIDKNGKWAIPARYVDVHDFSEGLAAVQLPASGEKGEMWGFIDTKGNMVIDAKFTREPKSFSMGHAVVVKRSGREVMIDKTGEVKSPEFSWLFPFFSTGYTLARLPEQQGWFVIDSDYRVVTGPVYGIEGKDGPYKERHGVFQTKIFGPGYTNGNTYLTTGEPLFAQRAWHQMGAMSDNLIHFTDDKGHGFVDYQGNVIFRFVQSEF